MGPVQIAKNATQGGLIDRAKGGSFGLPAEDIGSDRSG